MFPTGTNNGSVQGPAPVTPSPSPVGGLVNTGLGNTGVGGSGGTAPALYSNPSTIPGFGANNSPTTAPVTSTLGNNKFTTPSNQNSPITGLLSPHASLASSLSAGPVTSITTNADGTMVTKHANPQDLASDTITPPDKNLNGSDSTTGGYNQTSGLGAGSAPTGTPLPSSQTQNTSGTPTASGLLSKVAGFSNPDQGLQDLYTKQKELDTQYANDIGDAMNTPTDLNTQNARVSQIQNNYNAAKADLASTYQANLAERGQNIGAAESALSSATSQTSAPYGTPLFNPATGTVTLGGQPIGANNQFTPDQQMSSLAQAVANNSMSYSTAYSQLSSAFGPTVANTFLSKIQAINPQFNVNASEGTASGQQTAAATPGTIQSQQQTQIAGYQSALQQGQNLQSQLKDLITTFGLNPNDINAANSGLQAIAKNTSSPQYQILSNYINDIANTYAQVLTPSGGSQTDTTRSIAASMLDATAKGTSIISTMSALDQAAKAKIAGVSTTGSSNSTSSSSSGASGGWASLGD